MVGRGSHGPHTLLAFFAVTAVALLLLAWQAEEQGGFIDLWLTPDQQARIAYEESLSPDLRTQQLLALYRSLVA